MTLAAAACATGCATKTMKPGSLARVQPTSDKPRAGNAYLLRGFIGVFSAGVDRLTQQINETGIRAHVYQDDQWAALARTIRREYEGKSDAEPLVLIGHSYGADDVIRIARELDEANVRVDLLVTLDPVTPPPVPKNVRHAVNIYQSNGVWDALPFLRGVPVQHASASATRVENFDIRTDRRDLLGRDTDHFNIEKNHKVHEEVVGYVLMTCPPRRTWLAARDRALPGAVAARAAPARQATGPRLETRNVRPAPRNVAANDAQTAGHRLGN